MSRNDGVVICVIAGALPIHPDLNDLHKRLKDLQEEMQEHIKNNPEYLL